MKPMSKFIINLVQLLGQIVFDVFSETMCLSKVRTNLWPEVRSVQSIQRVTKFMLVVFISSLISVGVHTYHFGWFAPIGNTKEILGYIILDYDFNRLNRWSVLIVGMAVTIWVWQVYAVSKRLETIAYQILKALRTKYFFEKHIGSPH